MPFLEMRLAWVTRFDPVLLASRLQAYINLLPSIESLRLRNRFGKGEHAVIARLPVEMLAQIEKHLVSQERDTTLKAAKAAYRCFTGSCRTIDHFTLKQRKLLYAHYREDIDRVLAKSRASREDRTTTLEDCLDGYEEEEECIAGVPGVSKTHKSMRKTWYNMTDRTLDMTTRFTKRNDGLLIQHFGLRLWVAHGVNDYADHEHPFRYSTTAYLTVLTRAETRMDWQHSLTTDAQDEHTYVEPTEVPASYVLAPQKKPRQKSLARFGRALKILDLQPLATEDVDVDSTAGCLVEEGSVLGLESGKDNARGSERNGSSTWPALRLLMVNKDGLMAHMGEDPHS